MTDAIIPPGSTIGILGGGQLGRMTAMAAAQLGYRCVVLAPEADPPAGDVSRWIIRADYNDHKALDEFAEIADVVTLEFENVPTDCLDVLADRLPVRPNAPVLAVTQDRLAEKSAMREFAIAVTDFDKVDRPADLETLRRNGKPGGILKTRRMGYDGKGQTRLADDGDIEAAWSAIGGAPAILEQVVDFKAELSVITARNPKGEIRSFPPVENRHADHILKETIAPMDLPQALATEAVNIAETIAQRLDVVGLIAVEMFLTSDDRILVNELAPRPHNSGHWSIEGAPTSQFEQLVRAICNLPLGDTRAYAPTRMINLLGAEWQEQWLEALADPAASLHLYGKAETKPGRKMGHITRSADKGQGNWR